MPRSFLGMRVFTVYSQSFHKLTAAISVFYLPALLIL
jgi:hypothetical protein